MTRNELLRAIKGIPELAAHINEAEGKNFTNCKTDVLTEYWNQYMHVKEQPATPAESIDMTAFESAALSFLVTLEQKGVLDILLAKIKG